MTPKEVVKFSKEQKAACVRSEVSGFSRHLAALHDPDEPSSAKPLFEEGSGFDGSSIRGWQPINASDMLVIARSDHRRDGSVHRTYATLSLICNIVDPITKEDYYARSAQHRHARPEAYLKSTGIGDVVYFGPEPEFFIFDDVRYDQNQHSGYYFVDSVEGQWNTGNAQEGSEPRLQAALQGRLLPRVRRPTPSRTSARRWCTTMEKVGITRREAAPRGRHRRSGRDRHALPAAGEDGRRPDVVQVHRQERRPQARQDGDVHAEADLRRQRQRHARAPEHLEGREAALRRQRLRRHERAGDALHRRHPEARAGAGRVHQPDRPTAIAAWCRASRRR